MASIESILERSIGTWTSYRRCMCFDDDLGLFPIITDQFNYVRLCGDAYEFTVEWADNDEFLDAQKVHCIYARNVLQITHRGQTHPTAVSPTDIGIILTTHYQEIHYNEIIQFPSISNDIRIREKIGYREDGSIDTISHRTEIRIK